MQQTQLDVQALMDDDNWKEEIAKLIARKKIHMLLDPNVAFWSTLSMRLQSVMSFDVATFATDGKSMFYNPIFVQNIIDENGKTRAEKIIVAAIAHEVMHCAFGHMVRRGGRDFQIWNFACVTGDSLVSMTDGSFKKIKEVKRGDQVLSEFKGEIVSSKVLDTMTKRDTIMEIRFHGGSKLRCTPTHKLLTEKGYVEAQKLKEEDYAFLDKGRGCFHSEKSQNDDNHRNGKTSECEVSTSGLFSADSQSICGKKNSKKSKSAKFEQTDENRLGLLCGNRRRGRNNLYLQNKREVFPSEHNNIHNDSCSCGMVREAENVWNTFQKQQRESLLEDCNKRVSDNRYTEKTNALSSDKEEPCGVGCRIYQNSLISEVQRQTNYENDGYTPTGTRIERKRIKSIRRFEKTKRVFDLTTSKHSYIANGVICHNCDFSINHILKDAGFDVPNDWLIDDKYKDMSAEEIYPYLEQDKQQNPQSYPGDGNGGIGEVLDHPGNEDSNQDDQDDDDQDGDQDGKGSGSGSGKDDQSKGKQTPKYLSDAEKKQIASEWSVAAATAAKAHASKAGDLPGALKRAVDKLLDPKIPWIDVVREWADVVSRGDYTWARPNYRYMPQGCYLPSLYSVEVGDIALIMDVSGSVSDHQFIQFASEISSILEELNCNVYALYVDTSVRRVDEYDQDDLPLKIETVGGGGTDFRPGFDWLKKKGIEPEGVIYFTDMQCNNFPDYIPDYPVIWVKYGPDSSWATKPEDIPFGDYIEM